MQPPKSIRKRKRKFRKAPIPGLPFLNYSCDTKEDSPLLCRCVLDGQRFLVSSPVDIQALYENGCFGTSTVTHRSPLGEDNLNFEKQPYFHKVVTSLKPLFSPFSLEDEDKLMGRVDLANMDTNNGLHAEMSSGSQSEQMASSSLPLSKFDLGGSGEEESLDSLPHPKDLTNSGKDSLVSDKLELFPEEVMFLTFGIGCLTVKTKSGKTLCVEDLWKHFCDKSPNFPVSYAVYHYFRSKNWVPKIGASYGGAFVLYERGPEYFHSLYIAHIYRSDSPRPTWLEMCARQRLASHSAKVALICEVDVPEDFVPADPSSIAKLRIAETSLHRWTPSMNKHC